MNNVQTLLIIVSIFSFLSGGCKRQTQNQIAQPQSETASATQLKNPPEITSESEEGFHDLVFYIQDLKKLPDGTQSMRVLGNYKNQNVGLDITLSPTWKEGSLGKDVNLVTYQGIVTYRSIGSESDILLQAIDELYGTKLSPKAMSAEVRFTGITLGGGPRDLAKEPVQIKLFYELGGDDGYAEFYTNIELANHKLQIKEKDLDYRTPIVRVLKAN